MTWTRDDLGLLLDDLLEGTQLFVPLETAQEMSLGDDLGLVMDELASRFGCHIAFQQHFDSTPDQVGFRFTKSGAGRGGSSA